MANSILRPLKISVVFLLTFCWFFSSHAAERAELSVHEYGALPNISMMSISPSGDMIAFRNTNGERDLVVVISLKEKSAWRRWTSARSPRTTCILPLRMN